MSLAIVHDRVTFLIRQAAQRVSVSADRLYTTGSQPWKADTELAHELFLVSDELRTDVVLIARDELDALRKLQRQASP